MRIGFIGGTAFVGRHMVASAIERGHEVTVFHRGQTGTDVFPDIEHVNGDRAQDLDMLRGRRFDAVIDVCAYRPGEVHAVADAIGDEIDRYLYVSSVSAYRTDGAASLAEDSPLSGADDLADPTTEHVDDTTYGPLEAMCEDAARERFAERATVVRPCYVVGPHDRSDRFTSWVRRCGDGGPVLAAGPPDAPIQVIDARDLAAFALSLVETATTGAFNGVGPAAPIDWATLLGECISIVGSAGTDVVWADAVWLRELGLAPEVDFPMWGPPQEAPMMRCSPAKSLAAGLTLRPLADTIVDLDRWDRERGRPPLAAGLDRAEHDRVLAELSRR
jgi:2'-hydroxyisoflavone reductase